ncbi:ribosomal protein S6 kinase-like 1 [Lates japonicus]
MLGQSAASPEPLSSSPALGMSVLRLLKTWAAAAAAADAAAGAEGPGHGCLTSDDHALPQRPKLWSHWGHTHTEPSDNRQKCILLLIRPGSKGPTGP